VKVYLANYGWHSGVLLPLPDAAGRFQGDGRYIEFTFGDFDYMVNNRESVVDGVGAILLSPQAGLGRRVIAIHDDKVAREVKLPPRRLDSFYVSAAGVRRLTARLEARYRRHADTAVLNPAEDEVYVKDREHYWLANNCNHAARRWLTELGCDVRGSFINVGFTLAGEQNVNRPTTRAVMAGSQAQAQKSGSESVLETPSKTQ
jgi:hypothetical protein